MSHRIRTVALMDRDHLWTVEELEQMTPDERHRIISEGIVTDLSQVDPAFLKRVRAHARALLEERGLLPPDGRTGES